MLLDRNVIELKGRPLFERASMKTPFRIPNHFDDFACFFYMLDGTYEAIESTGSYVIGEKEALVKKCGKYLAHFIGSSNKKSCEAVAIYLYPDLLQEIYRDQVPTFLKDESSVTPPKKILANELIEKYISNLLVYLDNPELIDDELAILKIKELVMILLKSEQYENVKAFLQHVFSPCNLEFTSIIENNLFSNISIEELAYITNRSLSSFKREFKRIYEDTPARYIKKRRLERAADRLITEDETISRIAFQCGFQDPTTFSSAFLEKYGVTPSQYRLGNNEKQLAS